MAISINTNGHISIDGADTGLMITQHIAGSTIINRKTGDEVRMPRQRYALSCDKPASGVAGRAKFEADIREAMVAA